MAYSRSQLPHIARALRVGSLTKGLPSPVRQSARQSAAQVEALMKAFQKPDVQPPKGQGSQGAGGPISAPAKVGQHPKV